MRQANGDPYECENSHQDTILGRGGRPQVTPAWATENGPLGAPTRRDFPFESYLYESYFTYIPYREFEKSAGK